MGISIKVLAITVTVGIVAIVGSTIASSSIVSPVAHISDIGALTPENATSNLIEAAVMTKADFDREFTDVGAMPRPGNTPANRERLRDAGWKLISASR